VIPVCLTRTFGVMVRDTRQGNVLLAVMGVLWGAMLSIAWWAETHPNGPTTLAAGAAMEGKEVRFDIPASVLFAVSTTGTPRLGNSMHDSYTRFGGGATLLNILCGEVAPGVVGAGLYGILVLAVIAVFLAILILAANTADHGFPLLGSILAQDRYLLCQLHTRGDRLAFSKRDRAARRRRRLLFEPGVLVISVPWQLDSTSRRNLERVEHTPGEIRRGVNPGA
jgi:hypothetical protein